MRPPRRLAWFWMSLLLVGALSAGSPAGAVDSGCTGGEPSQASGPCELQVESATPNGHNTVGVCAANSRPVGGDQEQTTIGDLMRIDGSHPCGVTGP